MSSVMRPKRKCLLKFLLGFLLLVGLFICMLRYMYDGMTNSVNHEDKQPYFQRYVHPHNDSLKGVPFMFNKATYELGKKLISELEDGHRIQSQLSVEVLLKTVTPVTAVSTDYNHFNELMKNMHGLKTHKSIPQMKLIVYDLGLRKDEVKALRENEFVVYRRIDFWDYPDHIRNLKLYAWKPLIIEKVLAERGAILWMDSSILFKDNFTAIFRHMVEYQAGFQYYIPPAGHTMISAIHPLMLPYFPSKHSQDFSRHRMPQASAMVILNTKEIRENVMKWAILCSLDKDCISPPGAKLNDCDDVYPTDKYSGCHRYDQAMMSILVDNAFDGKYTTYTIQREQSKTFVQSLRWHPSLQERLIGYFLWYLQPFY